MNARNIQKAAAYFAALTIAALLACSGGAGPGADGLGGSLDGNYAAGPMSLPAPSIINKGLVICENVAGPTVECRGSAGAVPANSRVKLTVYDRFASASPSWTRWLMSEAKALPGNTDFCDANGSGAFGQSGDCSVLASTGEKIGICVAKGNDCISAELVLTVPVEGGVVSGATGIIKSLSTTPDGVIIFGQKTQPSQAMEKKSALSWVNLLIGTAQAQEVAVAPKLTFPPAVAAQCIGNPNVSVDATSSYKPGEDQWLTIKSQKGNVVSELFQVPGSQDDLQTINADNIGNVNFISIAMKNTLFLVARLSKQPVAQIVFPAPIKAMHEGGSGLEVLLEVPKGEPSQYSVKTDSFETSCVETNESMALTRPISSSRTIGHYLPPGEGFRVPQTFGVSGAVGEYAPTGEYQMVFSQQGIGDIPEWNGVLLRQTTPLKDFFVTNVSQQRAQMAALDPAGNRIVFVTRDLVSGESQVTPLSLVGLAVNPVAMKFVKYDRYPNFFVVLDSNEHGAKAVMIPTTSQENGELQANLANARSVDLGPIVADTLEMSQMAMWEWATFDRVGGQVKTFVLGPRD